MELKFGKYKNNDLETVIKQDIDYVHWLFQQSWLAKEIKEEIKRIKQQLYPNLLD